MAKKKSQEETKKPSGLIFPAWLYHKEYGAVLFTSEEDLSSAGDGWHDSPNTFEIQAAKYAFEKPLEDMNRLELVIASRKVGLREDEYQGRTPAQIIEAIKKKG